MEPVLYVQLHGVGLYRQQEDDGDVTLQAYPAGMITPSLRAYIRDHKREILEALQVPDMDYMVGNILALPLYELNELREAIATGAPGRLHYVHDAEALRRAEAVMRYRASLAERMGRALAA